MPAVARSANGMQSAADADREGHFGVGMRAPPDCIERRRSAAVAAWGLGNEVVVVRSGERVPLPGQEGQFYPFVPHPEYYYLTDRCRPGGVLAFDPGEGWVEFVPEPDGPDRLWGRTDSDDDLAGCASDSMLERWLTDRADRAVRFLGAPVPGRLECGRSRELSCALAGVRAEKDDEEMIRISAAVRATAWGFELLSRTARPGVAERTLQVELEAEFMRRGAEGCAYPTVIAAGPRTAIPHPRPTGHWLIRGDMVVADAGAQYRGYASRVSRTFVLNGSFSPQQLDLYVLVARVQAAAVGACVPGATLAAIRRKADLLTAAGLVDLGVLRGNAEDLVELGALSFFGPRPVSHHIGLGVRDGSSCDSDPTRPPACRRACQEVPLRRRCVVAIASGLAFSPAGFAAAAHSPRLRRSVDWALVERMTVAGGFRVADQVLVTHADPEVMTSSVPP
jgi:Xaa-Pro aminopeptidase